MKLNFKLLFALLLSVFVIYGQDLILTRDGKVLKGNVTQISKTEIQYRNCDSTGTVYGPVRVLEVSEVLEIQYRNGEKETFTVPPTTLPAAKASQSVIPDTPSMPPATVIPQDTSVISHKQNQSLTDTSTRTEPAGLDNGTFTTDLKKDRMAIEYYRKLKSDTLRQSWIERGGWIRSRNVGLYYTYMHMDQEGFDVSMNGGGYDITSYRRKIKPPSFKDGKTTWTGYNIGFGSSGSFVYGTSSMSILTSTMDISMTTINEYINVPMGLTVGVGHYTSDGVWGGVALTLNYVPSLSYRFDVTKMSGDGNMIPGQNTYTSSLYLNLGGMNFSMDFGSYSKMADKFAKEAHFTIFGFFLPSTDKTPLTVYIGLGVLIYETPNPGGSKDRKK